MAGLRLRVFPSTHLTADLPAYRDYREGVLLDVGCLNATHVLHKVFLSSLVTLHRSVVNDKY